MARSSRQPQAVYAGISWDADGFRVATVDRKGQPTTPSRHFQARDVDALVDFLYGSGRPDAIVDSTNGLLDARLLAAGLAVYRADAWALPDRPLLGSVPAAELARLPVREPTAVTRLATGQGTHTGREAELGKGFRTSVAMMTGRLDPGGCLIHGSRHGRAVALTFDDGPLPPATGQVLDILERYAVPATFFCVGMHVGAYREELIRILEQGHAIGNHTWSHPFLPELSRGQSVEQLDRTGEAIATATGGSVPTLFRPPFGALPTEPTELLSAAALASVLWDVDPGDWALPGADAIVRSVLDRVRPGSIVLLHDGGGVRSQTVSALPAIIEGLLARGFELVRVDDLAGTVERS